MSSVRDYLTPEPIMFVTDLIRGGGGARGDGKKGGGGASSSSANNNALLRSSSSRCGGGGVAAVLAGVAAASGGCSGAGCIGSSSAVSLIQSGPSIYERVRERKRKLEKERDNCEELRQKLEALREERETCTQRYKIKRRRELDDLIAKMEEEIQHTENGDKIKEFVESSTPYLKAYQRQQFCRRPQQHQQQSMATTNPTTTGGDDQDNTNSTSVAMVAMVGGVVRQVDQQVQPPPPLLRSIATAASVAPTSASLQQHQQQVVLTRGAPSVLDDYAVAFEGAAPTYDIEAKDTCKACGEPVQLHTGLSMLVCVKCGTAQPFLDATAALLSFSDDSYDYASFSYKRINHFTEWISAMQAKETTDIPQSVLDLVMERLADERTNSVEDITVHKVREILKKLKLRKYYEHTQLITCKITGRAPPRMTPTQEERIKLLFMAASTAFQQLCPPDRSNFLSYSFTLFKFSELLGYTEFLPNFALLRGPTKLRRQDEIYKALCETLDWEFIPSVCQ